MTAIYDRQWQSPEEAPIAIPAPSFDFEDTERTLTRVPMHSLPDFEDMKLTMEDPENVVFASRIHTPVPNRLAVPNIRHLLQGQRIFLGEKKPSAIPSDRLNQWLQKQTRIPYDHDDQAGSVTTDSSVIYRRPEKKTEPRYQNEDKIMWALNEKTIRLRELSNSKWNNGKLTMPEKKAVWDTYKEISVWRTKELSPSNKARLDFAIVLFYTCLDDVSHVES